jgi:signal transduction histidine kinase
MDDIKSKDDGIRIIFDEQEADPMIVEADKLKIYEVISNLLVNAVKFTRKKSLDDVTIRENDRSNIGDNMNDGIIIISSKMKSSPSYNKDDNSDITRKGRRSEVIVSIKDRGTGIDPDIQDKLFSKFATKSDTGSGLGLYISKGIVEAHGGKIWAENNRDGKGATFTFSLPIL